MTKDDLTFDVPCPSVNDTVLMHSACANCGHVAMAHRKLPVGNVCSVCEAAFQVETAATPQGELMAPESVYVLWAHSFDNAIIHGVYSTEDAARKVRRQLPKSDWQYVIWEFDLEDAPLLAE